MESDFRMDDVTDAGADVLWFLPTHGDGRYLATQIGARSVSLNYLSQIARAADDLGYFGVLLPTGRSCEDSWVVASALAPMTQRLRFLVAVRPGLSEPSMTARMAATLDRLSEGRLLINVVAGGDPVELHGDGVWLDHAHRYVATDEYLTVWRALLRGETVDFAGEHIRCEGGKLLFPPAQSPHPPLYFGGSSDEGQAVAAKHADVYLTWGRAARRRRREDRCGPGGSGRAGPHHAVRHPPACHRARDRQGGLEAADALIRHVDDAAIAMAQQTFARFDSVGQQRMARLHGGRRDRLEISPNLWAGVGLVRGGAGTALVGDPHQVAERMREYIDVGIDRFILSGYPHLEECLPVRRTGVSAPAAARHDRNDPHRIRKSWPVRRDHRQCRGAIAPRCGELRPSPPEARYCEEQSGR